MVDNIGENTKIQIKDLSEKIQSKIKVLFTSVDILDDNFELIEQNPWNLSNP
jgi:hypothetical protein